MAISVFSYHDYREYLRAFWEHKSQTSRGFSVRGFLKKAGIANPSFFRQVLESKRNLTEQTLSQFQQALQPPPHEAEYFAALVRFNQAKHNAEKQAQYLHMRELAGQAKVRTVGERSFGFYEKWYIPVLRELLCIHPHPHNMAELGRSLHPPVPTTEVREAVKRLIDLGFIQKTPQGTFQQTDPLLSTGFEVHSMAVRDFNRQMVELAGQSLHNIPVPERNITGVTMAISESTYHQITHELHQMQDRILQLVANDPQADRVYQLNTLLFPVSKKTNPSEAPCSNNA